jgi:peptide-methionine (S)-S-oxide reductase
MPTIETATLGEGCFWRLEAVYGQMAGVAPVVSGYMGGSQPEPAYREVCGGKTGHAEVVEIAFDPGVTSAAGILEVFFTIHDPTTKDRQGNDAGAQYRPVIFYHSESQRAIAEELIRELDAAGIRSDPIVTEVRPASNFYRAEDCHQAYFRNHPEQPYCAFVVAPKVRKFKEEFGGWLKPNG